MTYIWLFTYNLAISHLTDAYAALNVQNLLPEFFKKTPFIAPSSERFGFFPVYACK